MPGCAVQAHVASRASEGRGGVVAKAYGHALSTAFDELTEDEALLIVEVPKAEGGLM